MRTSILNQIHKVNQRIDNWMDNHIFWGIFGLIILFVSGILLGLLSLSEILGIQSNLLFIGFTVLSCSVLGMRGLWWVIQERKRLWNQRQLLRNHRRLLLVQTLNLIPYALAVWWFVTLHDEITNLWLKVLFLPNAMVLLTIVLSWPIILSTWPKIWPILRQRDTLEFCGGAYLAAMVLSFIFESNLFLT